MTDSHVHVGWFVDRYHSPDDVTVQLRSVGVKSVLISSTSTCAEDYDLVLHEMEWLQDEWQENLIPALWITPRMLKEGKLQYMLDSGVPWKALKMHWQAHTEFFSAPDLVETVLTDSRLVKLPILLHTGRFPECEACVFERLIAHYPDRTFILAHGRPLDDTILILNKYNNVYVDTAFMPISDIMRLIDANLAKRILWGSDAPINEHFFSAQPTTVYLSRRIEDLRTSITAQQFRDITEHNFYDIFNSNKTTRL